MMQAEIQNDSINNQKLSSSIAVHDMVRTHMRGLYSKHQLFNKMADCHIE